MDFCEFKRLPCQFFVSQLHKYRFVWIQKVAMSIFGFSVA
jgi:hypothetical protein